MTALLALFILFVVLQFADAATTLAVIKRGGKEKNPVMIYIMGKLGTNAALLATKAVAIGVIYAILPWMPLVVLGLLCAWYTAIVAFNTRSLVRM